MAEIFIPIMMNDNNDGDNAAAAAAAAAADDDDDDGTNGNVEDVGGIVFMGISVI